MRTGSNSLRLFSEAPGGFHGVTYYLILRILYYLAKEKGHEDRGRVKISGDLYGFLIEKDTTRIVINARRTFNLGEKIRPDIVVYKPEDVKGRKIKHRTRNHIPKFGFI